MKIASRVFRIWQIGVAAGFFAMAIMGVVKFPYAPIRPNGATFSDKQGHPQTLEDYQRFRVWERSFSFVGGAFALTAIGSAIFHYRKNRSLRIPQKA
jgi:hypothetical protein